MIWNKSFVAFVEDARNSLLETTDNGFLFYSPISDLAPDKRGEDSDVYQDMPYASLKVFKFDLDGNLLWAKNIKNFIARDNDSYLVATSDGGYALAGNITEHNSENPAPYDFDKFPGLAKFDKDFNFQWAKSMEGIPLEMAAAIPKATGGYELGSKKIRQGAIAIHGFVKTTDNGYLVLGNFTSLSLMSDSFDLKSGVKNWLVGFKFNSAGNLEWTKKLTFGFNELTSTMTNFSITLTNDEKIVMSAPITWADDNFTSKTKETNDLIKWYKTKYGETEMNKEDSEKSKESLADWKIVQAMITKTQDSFRFGVFIIKTDQNLNTSWAEFLNPQRGAVNYVLKPTTDSGIIVAGEYESKDIKSKILSSVTYYKDGFLAKLDASGNIKNNKSWITAFNGQYTTELMTPYAVSNNLTV